MYKGRVTSYRTWKAFKEVNTMQKTLFSHTCFRSCFVSLLVSLSFAASVTPSPSGNDQPSEDTGELTKASSHGFNKT